MKDTVTLSIEKYEEMKNEIETLRKQVQEKTIYKYIIPPVYGYVCMIALIILYLLIN